MQQSEVKKLVMAPKNGNSVMRGRLHARRLRFHNDATLSYYDSVGSYLYEFLLWVKGILPADKYDRFCQLVTYPLPTNELVESIYKTLARVFEGENRIIDVKLSEPSLSADWREFFDNDDFQRKAFEAMQNCIDTIVVCDAPIEQTTEYPEPYYYMVSIDRVIDLDVEGDDLLYVIFDAGNGKTVAIDTQFTRVFTGERDRLRLVSEVEHGLGYAPANMLWGEKLTATSDINRKSPITSVLGELDKYLFNLISREYAEMYGKYPIVVSYDVEQEFKGADSDNKNAKQGVGSSLLGAGSILTYPAPSSKDEPDLNGNAVRFISAEPQVLAFIDRRLREDKDKIYKSVVGDSGEMRNDAAKNEKQIESGFESKQDVITRIKYNLEEIHEWVIKTMCKMRYGDRFLEGEVDYGTQFYLTSEYDLLNAMSVAKDKKVPDVVISDITRQYFETKYRTDSQTKERMKIVMDIDPFPSKSINEVWEIYKLSPNLIGDENMMVKIYLDSLLQRFERENMPLQMFANQYEYSQKIEIINQTIRGYVKTSKINFGQQTTGVSASREGNQSVSHQTDPQVGAE